MTFSFGIGASQEFNPLQLDNLTDEGLLKLFWEYDRDTIAQERIVRTYLQRARLDNDTIKMARAYDRLGRIFSPHKNIAFADSIIELTKEIDHITYPGIGYLLKAHSYHKLRDLQNEFKFYLKAYELAKARNNLSHKLFILDQLTILQVYWGDKKDALRRQHERHELVISEDYFQLLKINARDEFQNRIEDLYKLDLLNSYRTYVICYLYLAEYNYVDLYLDEIETILKDGVDAEWNSVDSLWVKEVKAESFLLRNNYLKSASMASEILNDHGSILSNSQSKNLNRIYGESLVSMGLVEKGLTKLLIADSLASLPSASLNPIDDRRLFYGLYQAHLSLGDLENAILFLDKVISVEEQKNSFLMYLEPALIRDKDIPELVSDKELLITDLTIKRKRSVYFQCLTAILLVLSITLAILYFNRQAAYKARFEQIVNQAKETKKESRTNGLSNAISQEIISGLDRFERQEGFLLNDLSLSSLAKILNTNNNYLSRVINFRFEKNFPQYLHDLRVEYAKDRLLKDEKFRRYTIKAIAEESGYNNVESFSRAFFKRLGIYPSFYIRNLNKNRSTPN